MGSLPAAPRHAMPRSSRACWQCVAMAVDRPRVIGPRQARPLVRCNQASLDALALCALGRAHEFGPWLGFKLKILFPFPIQFRFNLNFGNSYLFEYCSKIHETNSVGFLISSSIHEKYKTK
jgi:hypothetical protein